MLKLISRFWHFMTEKQPVADVCWPRLDDELLPASALDAAPPAMQPQTVDEIAKVTGMHLRGEIDRYRFKSYFVRLLASGAAVEDVATGMTLALGSFIGRTQHIDFRIVADRADGEAILRVAVNRK